MKKLLFLAVAIASVTSLSSCKKDYTCTCTVSGISLGASDLGTQTKSDADATCTSMQTTYQVADPAATCVLATK